jgi:hypothetical protein
MSKKGKESAPPSMFFRSRKTNCHHHIVFSNGAVLSSSTKGENFNFIASPKGMQKQDRRARSNRNSKLCQNRACNLEICTQSIERLIRNKEIFCFFSRTISKKSFVLEAVFAKRTVQNDGEHENGSQNSSKAVIRNVFFIKKTNIMVLLFLISIEGCPEFSGRSHVLSQGHTVQKRAVAPKLDTFLSESTASPFSFFSQLN